MVDDERVNLQVPEQIAISYELAGLGSRFLAAIIDTFILAVTLGLVAFVAWLIRAYLTGASGVSFLTSVIILSASVLVYVAYHVYFEVTARGKPPGKSLTGLRVISVDGAAVGFEQSSVRNIMRLIDMLPTSYAVGLISLLVTARNQRLGDLAAGTMVVKERLEEITDLPEEPAPPPDLPPEVSADVLHAVRAGARTITREEERTIRRFLERRFDLGPAPRRQLAARLARPIRQRFPGLQAGQLRDPETLLEVVARALDERD